MAGLGEWRSEQRWCPALVLAGIFQNPLKGAEVDPTQIRSFSDLLLGSPATGFPTLGLIRNYVLQMGTEPFFTLMYLGGTIVPRIIWPGKPLSIDKMLELHYRLIENPSTFWFGELYYSFGIAAVHRGVR